MMFEVVTGTDGTASTEVYENWYATAVYADDYQPDDPGINVEEDTTVMFERQPEQPPTDGSSDTADNETDAETRPARRCRNCQTAHQGEQETRPCPHCTSEIKLSA